MDVMPSRAVPTRLNVKRKASDLPPDALILPNPKKHAQTPHTVQGARAVYVLQKGRGASASSVPRANRESSQTGETTASRPQLSKHRTFLLSRSTVPTYGHLQSRHSSIATFTEAQSQPADDVSQEIASSLELVSTSPERKRPGRGAAIRNGPFPGIATIPSPEILTQANEKVAATLHQFAVEQVSKDARRKIIPKLSGARSQEIHRQRVAANQTNNVNLQPDTEMSDVGGDVYDTYVLVSDVQSEVTHADDASTSGNIGYLIIQDEDRDIWESYIDDESDEAEEEVDEDDENAEGYYGADYPEDELDSDDEFDRDPYRYRHGKDEWEDTAYSDDEEYDRMMNPFTASHSKSFSMKRSDMEHE